MRTASPSLRSVRALTHVLLTAVVVVLGLAAATLLQPRPTSAADPIWACYKNNNFNLSYTADPDDCKNNETAVRLDDSDHPIWVCLPSPTGQLRYAGDGGSPITSRCNGAPPSQFFRLPGDTATTLCYHQGNGKLTLSPCGRNETQLVIPPGNRAPVAADQNVSVNEDDSATIQLQATDADGDALTFSIVAAPGNGSLGSITNTSCTGTVPNTCTADVDYTPNADFFGSDSFTFTANDGNADSNEATISITVNPINDTPTDIALSNASVAENEPGGTTVGTFSTTDPDPGDTHTYSFVSGSGDADNADFQIVGDELQTAHGFDFEGDPERTIRVQTDDGNGGTFSKAFTITVTNVNEAPTAIALDDNEIGENRPTGTAVGILSTTDPDAGDTFTYTLVSGSGDDDNASFQIDGDRLESAEVFDFETKSSYTVRVRSTDAGGLFVEETFTIIVVDMNEDPTDIALSNTTIDENIAANSVVGTFSTTDPDTGDTFTYTLISGTGDDDNAAFTITGDELRINASPNFEAQDTYQIRVRSTDAGGLFVEETFTITVTDLNEAPIAGTDSYDAIGNTQLRINSPTSPASSVAFTSSATSPLANDTDPDTNPAFNTLEITAAGTCTKGGTLTLHASDHAAGRLTYLPPQGIASTSPSDTDDCTYTLSDGTNNVSGTVEIQITDLVWYVDDSASAGGDGRSTSLYNTLTPLNGVGGIGDEDDADDYIFVFQGTYSGGLVLETGQRLFGQPNGLTVGPSALIAAGGSNPTLTNSGGAGITLANGVDVERINVDTTSGAGIVGTGVTTATIGANTSITNTTGNGFELSGAAGGTISVGAAINNTGGKQISIQNRTGGTVTFSAAVSGTGTGVLLSSNTGATIRFTGGLVLSTGGNNAFAATAGGTVEVTGSANTITTTTGTALNVVSTSIGVNGLTFQSISANGAANGIVLNTTGTGGGLTVTGSGTANSGGTIQNTTGVGISLTSAVNISLNRILIANTGSSGISGSGLSDPNAGDAIPTFELRNSRITSPGDADGEQALNFGNSGSPANNTGRIVIADTIVEQFEDFGLTVANNAGSLTLDVTGSLSGTSPNFDSTMKFDDNNDTHGESAVLVSATGSAAMTVNITGIYTNNVEGSSLLLSAGGSGGTDVNLLNNAFNNVGGPDNFPNAPYVVLASRDQHPLTFDVQGNHMLDAREGVVVSGDGNVEGRIGGDAVGQGNTITGVAFDGLRLDMDGNVGDIINSANFTWTILIKNNIVTGAVDNLDQGLQVLSRDHVGTLNLTVTDNSFTNFFGEAIRYFAGERVTPTPLGDTNGQIRITNNTFTNTGFGGAFDISLDTTDQAVACFDITGNSTPDATFTIDFEENETSAQSVTQASLAAVSTANDNATVTNSVGSVAFNVPCNPPLPTNG